MSFRTAYNSLKSTGYRRGLNRGMIRDNTPEEDKKMMDDYYTRYQTPKSWYQNKKALI